MKRRVPLATFIDVTSKSVLVARRENIEQYEENTLLGNTPDLLPVRVEDVPAMAGERDATVLEDKLSNREDDRMNIRVLEHEVVERAICFSVDNGSLFLIWNKCPVGALVLQAFPLPIALADSVGWECLFAIGDVRLRAGIQHRPPFARNGRWRKN